MQEIQSSRQTLHTKVEPIKKPNANQTLFTLSYNLLGTFANIKKTAIKKIIVSAAAILAVYHSCCSNSLAIATSAMPVSADTETTSRGWQEIDGAMYYFSPDTGKMLTGWQKIGGKYYYFTVSEKNKGIRKTNCIAGTKKSGYYYVDQNGVRVDSAEMNAAVRYVNSHTKKSWTPFQKLQACYQALRSSYTYRHFDGVPQGAELSDCACSLFDNGRGNCYRYASGMACIATAIGYRARVVTGKVTSVYGGWAEHGWAQILQKGKWKLCDVGMWQFMTDQHPVRSYAPSAIYSLKAKNGNVIWKKQPDRSGTS